MIVVDMQNDFVAPGGGLETPAARAMVPKLVEAMQICRSAGIKVSYTTHAHRRDGCDMGCSTTYIRRSPIEPPWSMALQEPEYTPKLLLLGANTSSRSIATVASLGLTSTSDAGDFGRLDSTRHVRSGNG